MAHSPEQTPQAEPQLDRSAPVNDNASTHSSQIWSSSLDNWNKSDKQMSPWKDADVNSQGFASSSKLLGNLFKNQSTPGSGDTLDMSVPADGQKLDVKQLGFAQDGTPRKEGDPSEHRVKRNASQNGEQEKVNKSQNGIEANPDARRKDEAQNGGEPNVPKENKEEKKLPTEPKVDGEDQKKEQPEAKKEEPKSEEQKRAEEQKKLESALFDKNLTSEQKLGAARELVRRGVTNVNGVDASGAKSSLRLETVAAGGDREMVHVFNTREGGKEKTALRGISRQDGSWEQQRDRRGNHVSYEGKGAAELAALRPQGAVPETQPRQDGTRPDGTRPDGTRPNAKVDEKSDRKRDAAPESLEKKTDQSPDADATARLNKMFDDASKQAKGKVGRMVKTDQGVYLKSDFDVDVDGSPRAKQLDRYGSTETSLRYRNGRSVNAEEVPYIVLQKDKYAAMGVQLGDMALVRDTKTGRIAAAVFADGGPNNKTGEGSINLGREGLGLRISPNSGIEEKRFEYLVKPGTNGGSRPRNQAEMLQRIDDFKRQMGLKK